MTSPPRVTVLMAVYNGERWLEEAVRSILDQEFRDFEFVIVDDGSVDGSRAILTRIGADDPRVIVIANESNRGLPESLNRGLEIARGEYVARQDADDLSEPGRLSAQVALLDSRPDVALVSTNYHVIDEKGTLLRSDRRDRRQAVVEYFLHFSNVIGGHTQVMFRRDAVLDARGYDARFRPSEDYDLWLRLAQRGGIVILPVFAMRYRLHTRSMSAGSREAMRSATLEIVQGALTRLLGREVSETEAAAVRAVGGIEPPGSGTPMLAIADQLFSEGLSRAEADGMARDDLRAVRSGTARLFANRAAVLFALQRNVRGAARCFIYALRWSVAGAASGFASTLSSLLLVKWRQWRAR